LRCFSFACWTDIHAAEVKPKVVIAHTAMDFRMALLWVTQDQDEIVRKIALSPLQRSAESMGDFTKHLIRESSLDDSGDQQCCYRQGFPLDARRSLRCEPASN
jgi:hypothetical protein